jgi:heme-degrading monooxygenase HmoA
VTVIRVAVYPIDSERVDELRRSIDESLIPLYQKQPGFRSLSIAHCGDEVVSVSHWDEETDADRGSKAAIEWAATAPGNLGPPTSVRIGPELNRA